MLQPGRDLLRIALRRTGQRFLRGKAPPLQIKLHRRKAEASCRTSCRSAPAPPAPSTARRAIASGRGICSQSSPARAALPTLRQHKLIANTPPALSSLEPGRAVAPECATPTADRPAMHSDSQRRLHVRRALLDKKHSALAKSFLRPLIQFAGIAKLHSCRLSELLRYVICLTWDISSLAIKILASFQCYPPAG